MTDKELESVAELINDAFEMLSLLTEGIKDQSISPIGIEHAPYAAASQAYEDLRIAWLLLYMQREVASKHNGRNKVLLNNIPEEYGGTSKSSRHAPWNENHRKQYEEKEC